MSKRAFLIAPILPLVLLLLLAAYLAYDFSVSLERNRALTLRTRDVIQTASQAFSLVQEAESSGRGYVLTAEEAYLGPYNDAVAVLPERLDRLATLVAGDPVEAKNVADFSDLVQAKMAVLSATIETARGEGFEAARSMVQTDIGRTLMQDARAALAAILEQENRQLAGRQAAIRDSTTLLFIATIGAALIAIIGQIVASLAMLRANRRLRAEMAERARAEAARQQSDALYRACFEYNAESMFLLQTQDGTRFLVEEINPAYEGATGLVSANLRGRELSEVLPPAIAGELAQRCRQVVDTGAPVSFEQTSTDPAVRRSWEIVLAPVRGDSGTVERIVGSARDVTERRQAEEAMRQSQKLEAVGHLTGGVAHDFNNLLQAIRTNLDLIAGDIADRERPTQRLRNAIAGTERAATLTRQLLAFARRQPLEPKILNLGRIIGGVSEMLRRTLGERIEVETVVAGGLWNTLADPTQVETTLLNLAVNARDAMPDGGKLTIEASNASLDETYARQHAEVTAGQYVLLAVTDTGAGMAKETIAQAFEPFFTTKADGKGTGLGLSQVYGFVKQSGGHIKIYSEPDHGTTVKIYLPRARGEATWEPERQAETLIPTGSGETILVVEDEAEVRTAAVAMLRELGYRTLEAGDALSALGVLERNADIDLVFTDVVMPGPLRTGEFARRVAEQFPGVPILFSSGYTENAIIHHGRLDEGVHFLSKPYKQEDLARKIRAVLAGRPRARVLVVEDDGLVRMSAVDMLEELGFSVEEAFDGSSALARLQHGPRIDVLLTDIGLPDIRGPELANRARSLQADLKVIFATGYDEPVAVDGEPAVTFLAKPYKGADLAEALDKVMRQRAASA